MENDFGLAGSNELIYLVDLQREVIWKHFVKRLSIFEVSKKMQISELSVEKLVEMSIRTLLSCFSKDEVPPN